MFIESYLQTATHLFEQYDLQMPLHLYTREYFRNNKKFGSRDRKYISELLYGIYRLGRSNEHIPVRDRLIIGSWLSGRLPVLFFSKINTTLSENAGLSFEEKIVYAKEHHDCNFQLPFSLTKGLKEEEFIKNLFSQPNVFIRIRQHKTEIEQALNKAEIKFRKISDTCFSFDANVKLNEILEPKDYVIQDLSSQYTGNYFTPTSSQKWWDCCAASGGKSIMLLDKNSKVALTVSDIRESILKNLHERMQLYGFGNHYVSFMADVASDVSNVIKGTFDGIICDIPCTGSGTWARSPEQYYFFTEEKLQQFILLQQAILTNIIQYLKPGGSLFYITCSVIENENEMLLSNILKVREIQILRSEMINKTKEGGDCMYIAEIKNS